MCEDNRLSNAGLSNHQGLRQPDFRQSILEYFDVVHRTRKAHRHTCDHRSTDIDWHVQQPHGSRHQSDWKHVWYKRNQANPNATKRNGHTDKRSDAGPQKTLPLIFQQAINNTCHQYEKPRRNRSFGLLRFLSGCSLSTIKMGRDRITYSLDLRELGFGGLLLRRSKNNSHSPTLGVVEALHKIMLPLVNLLKSGASVPQSRWHVDCIVQRQHIQATIIR